MALDLTLLGLDRFLRDLAGVNAVVVDNKVDELVSLKPVTEFVYQLDEEGGTFTGAVNPDEFFPPSRDGTGDIVFFVFPRSLDFLLGAR